MFSLRTWLRITLLLAAVIVAIVRLASAFAGWFNGNDALITAYAFSVFFPLVIIFLLGNLSGTKTKEGLLMRLAAMLQFELMLLLPQFALHLALGLPVAFLVVELFMTRFPPTFVSSVQKVVIA